MGKVRWVCFGLFSVFGGCLLFFFGWCSGVFAEIESWMPKRDLWGACWRLLMESRSLGSLWQLGKFDENAVFLLKD